MPHWSCSSVLCYNNHMTKDGNGEKVRRYRLPTDSETQAAYTRFFKTTTSFNWKSGYICAAHWSSGVRETPLHLPDVLLPPGHFEILKTKYERAKSIFKSAAKPTKVQRRRYRNAKKVWGCQDNSKVSQSCEAQATTQTSFCFIINPQWDPCTNPHPSISTNTPTYNFI